MDVVSKLGVATRVAARSSGGQVLALWLALLLAAATVLPAEAGIRFSRRAVEFHPGDRFTTVSFTNEGSVPIELTFETSRWGVQTKAGNADLEIYPRQTRMNPGESQTMRLFVRTAEGRTAPAPAFFRLVYRYRDLDPAAPPEEAPAGAVAGQLRFQTAVSIPVAYIDKNALPMPVTRLERDANGAPTAVVVGNTGRHALRITHVERDGSKSSYKRTILPGEAARLTLPSSQLPVILHARDIEPIIIR